MPNQNLNTKAKSLGRIEKCRVVEIGVEGFAECLRQGPNSCPHALPFGYWFLCSNPRLDEIIANTKKTKFAAQTLN